MSLHCHVVVYQHLQPCATVLGLNLRGRIPHGWVYILMILLNFWCPCLLYVRKARGMLNALVALWVFRRGMQTVILFFSFFTVSIFCMSYPLSTRDKLRNMQKLPPREDFAVFILVHAIVRKGLPVLLATPRQEIWFKQQNYYAMKEVISRKQ